MSDEGWVSVIGDCTLDVTAAPRGASVRGGDQPASIRVGPGGQGANVAVRLARRGIGVRLVTALGADLAGDWLRERLAAEGVAIVGVRATAGATTSIVVAILDETGERTMLSDRAPIALGDAALATLGPSRWVHCSGYVLRDPAEARPIAEALGDRADGTRLSIGGGSAGDVQVARTLLAALARMRPDLLIVSLDEARWLVGDLAADAAVALSDLGRSAGVVVVTAGSDGADAGVAGAAAIHVPAAVVPGPVLDTTGAGDTFAAALIARLRDAAWPPAPDALRSAVAEASLAGGLAARVPGAQGPIVGERGTATVSGA